MSDDKDKTPAPATDQTTPAAPDKEKKEDSKAAASGGDNFNLSDYSTISSSIFKTLSDIPFTHLIADPLRACVDAQNQSNEATLNYMQKVAFVKDEKTNTSQAIKVDFEFVSGGKLRKISVPLITLVPINFITLNSINISFKAQINASASNSYSEMTTPSPETKKQEAPEEKKKAADDGSEEKKGKEEQKKDDSSKDKGGDDKKDKESSWWDKGKEIYEEAKPIITAALGDLFGSDKKKDDKKESAAASYSNKKDSVATRESKYSVQTTIDFDITAGTGDMPSGLAKILEVLSSTVDIYDPDGELSIPQTVDVAVGEKELITFKNPEGVFDASQIKITPDTCTTTKSDNGIVVSFNAEGTYTITAGKKSEKVVVVKKS
jgi:hypothetical protein